MHREVLTDEASKLLPQLKFFDDFYLAGGTALALQLGHRISADFDFFSEKKISQDLLPKIEKNFKNIKVLVNNADELSFLSGGIKTTLLHYPFPLIFPLIDFEGLRLAGIKEIAVMKAYTLGRRGTFKDYVDLYFILLDKIDTIHGIIANAEKKYQDVFNSRLFLEQLVYLEDIQDTAIRFLRKEASIDEIRDFFGEQVKKARL